MAVMNEESLRIRLDRSTIHLLHRAGQCAEEVFAEEFGADGLTPRQYAVLLTVSQNEGFSQTALVERTGIDRSTLADVIRRMLKKGLLQRKRTETDARAYSVRLSAAGREALNAAEPAAIKADRRLLASLSPERRSELINALNEIVEAVCAARDQAQGKRQD